MRKTGGKIHCVVEPPIALASSSFTSIFQMVQRQLYLIPKLMMYPIIKMRIHIKAGCCFHTLSTIKEILITIKIIDSINKSTHLSPPKKSSKECKTKLIGRSKKKLGSVF